MNAPFVKVPHSLQEDERIRSRRGVMAVYIALRSFAAPKAGGLQGWPLVAEVAKRARCCYKKALNDIHFLAAWGYVEQDTRRLSQRQTANLYTFPAEREQESFSVVECAVLSDGRLSGYDLCGYAGVRYYMRKHPNGENIAAASIRQLAERAGLSEATLRKSLKKLERLGYIRRRGITGGRGNVNAYELLFRDGVPPDVPAEYELCETPPGAASASAQHGEGEKARRARQEMFDRINEFRESDAAGVDSFALFWSAWPGGKDAGDRDRAAVAFAKERRLLDRQGRSGAWINYLADKLDEKIYRQKRGGGEPADERRADDFLRKYAYR